LRTGPRQRTNGQPQRRARASLTKEPDDVRRLLYLALPWTLLLILIAPGIARAQLLVYPRRPGQTNVRYAGFDWRYVDLLTHENMKLDIEWQRGPRFHMGPYRAPAMGTPWAWPAVSRAPLALDEGEAASDARAPAAAAPASGASDPPRAPPTEREVMQTAGGIRLYFYERERDIAERAAASIEDSYRYLAAEFAYAPRKTFAYFLYSSYIEFLQTDLFPIQEGVLGVTSPRSLELTLPYFGDQRLFADVSTHELAHEFTLQKLITVAHDAGLPDAATDDIPLWFIEGSAEYYAKRGLDPEAEVLVRDVVINPSDDGRALGDFFEDRLDDGLWTYKVGQARCAFLEETYGKGTLQRILEETPRLVAPPEHGGLSGFRALVAEITHDGATRLSARFERWIKRRAYTAYLKTSQELDDMSVLTRTEGLVQTLATSPSGQLLLYRSIDRETGTTGLFLLDRHSAADVVRVAQDGVPGIESLHPVAGRNFDVTDHRLSFVAQSKGRDVIYVQGFTHAITPVPCADRGPRAKKTCHSEVDLDLGVRHKISLGEYGVLTVDALALSPDGRGLAFVGLGENGRKDLFMIPDLDAPALDVVALTHDVAAEREVSWGAQGIVFNSDATGHGKYNLFRVDPAAPHAIERLTYEPRDEMSPKMMPDGRVFFVAYDSAGANLYEVRREGDTSVLVRHTDVSTGLYDVSPGPDGSVWALYHKGHKRTPVRIAARELRQERIETPNADTPRLPAPRLSLGVDRAYDPFRLQSWAPDGFFILAGFSGAGVYGSLIATASDRLHDHGLVLSSSVFGSFDLFDVDLTYINQERRLIWGAGLFHDVGAIFDETFAASDDLTFVSYRRFFGGEGILRYPFSQFVYVQGELAVGGADYFVSGQTEQDLNEFRRFPSGVDLLDEWNARNQGLRLHTEADLSLGISTIGYHRATGPIRGSSILLSHRVGAEPFDDMTFQQTRLDAEHYVRVVGAANLLLRGALGATTGSQRAPQFFLSSFHTLRGVPFGDVDYLLGRDFFYSTVEFQFPIVTFVEFPLIDLEGVLAADFGGVGDDLTGVWDRRVLDLVFGVNLGFAPLVLRIHFGQPIGIGAPVPNDGHLTFNLSLVWRYQ
jgi:hypothetical protein